MTSPPRAELPPPETRLYVLVSRLPPASASESLEKAAVLQPVALWLLAVTGERKGVSSLLPMPQRFGLACLSAAGTLAYLRRITRQRWAQLLLVPSDDLLETARLVLARRAVIFYRDLHIGHAGYWNWV